MYFFFIYMHVNYVVQILCMHSRSNLSLEHTNGKVLNKFAVFISFFLLSFHRLAAEMDRQRSSMDQMNTLQRQIAQKDQELMELQLCAQAPAQQLAALQREYDGVLRENQQLRHRWGYTPSDFGARSDFLTQTTETVKNGSTCSFS